MSYTNSIEQRIAVLSDSGKGVTLELNKVSWSGKPAKYDLRHWNTKDNERIAYKGLSLSDTELKALYNALKTIFDE